MTGLTVKLSQALLAVSFAAAAVFSPAKAETGIAPPEDSPAVSDEPAAQPGTDAASVGRMTGRKLPRFVSMKAATGRARRGPSMSHRIDWVFTQRGLPLMITDEFGLWRRVQAVDGSGGWMHYILLSGVRYVMVTEEGAELRVSPDESAQIRALAEKDLIAKLGKCTLDWCRISAGGYKGWVSKTQIWGVEPDEIRN